MKKKIVEIRGILDCHGIPHFFREVFEDVNKPLTIVRYSVSEITFKVCSAIHDCEYVEDVRIVHSSLLNQMFLEISIHNEC